MRNASRSSDCHGSPSAAPLTLTVLPSTFAQAPSPKVPREVPAVPTLLADAVKDRIRAGTRARLYRHWEIFADLFPARPWLGGKHSVVAISTP